MKFRNYFLSEFIELEHVSLYKQHYQLEYDMDHSVTWFYTQLLATLLCTRDLKSLESRVKTKN